MIINYNREKIPITKEEYESNIYKRKDNSLLEIIKETLSKFEFIKDPIYKESGIKSVLNNEIIDYKYYKLGDYKSSLICNENDLKKLWQHIKYVKNVDK